MKARDDSNIKIVNEEMEERETSKLIDDKMGIYYSKCGNKTSEVLLLWIGLKAIRDRAREI